MEQSLLATKGGNHLKRFHQDHQQHLTGYTVFHGDEMERSGEALLTSIRGRPPISANGTFTADRVLPPDFTNNYNLVPSPGGTLLSARFSPANTHTGSISADTCRSNPPGTAYMYQTGTYISKSGLPPLAYKPWSSEYIGEYRSPKERKEHLKALTQTFGTQDALRTSRYQFRGYPATFQHLESSLTQRGQTAPDYESKVVAF